jgi:hypothetical protein
MESEEFEQIPWASLVAEQEEGIDRRVYLAVGIVGLLVIAVFGMRLVSGGSQPPPIESAAVESPTTSIVGTASEGGPPTSMVIAEADLRVEAQVPVETVDRLVEVTAEWFVIDWFTRDGSEETVRSIRAALAPALEIDTIPHETDGESASFVEWAKTVESEPSEDGIDVTIAYRAIRETEKGFVRDPVKTVLLSLQYDGLALVVSSLPSAM